MWKINVICFAIFIPYYCDCLSQSENHWINLNSKTSPRVQAKAAEEIIRRLLPDHAHKFRIFVDFNISPPGKSSFQIFKTSEQNSTVQITGSTGIAATRGFYYYLNKFCGCHISWEGKQLSLPIVLPEANVSVISKEQFRYFQNVCTFSYSYAWWTWRQWQSHIDWLALNGVNLVLAPIQEFVWLKTYQRLGLNNSESIKVLAGPPFLAWQRMGNIGHWGGPPSPAWLKKQNNLQRKILRKLQNLGVIVVLPAFAGHIPLEIKRLYPNSNTTELPQWNGFTKEYSAGYFLDPSDSLFDKISETFHDELTKVYHNSGISGIYFADPFNEIVPSGGKNYVHHIADGVYKSIIKRDPASVWLLQAWMFVHDPYWTQERIKSFLTAIPVGRLILLDLQAEQNSQYDKTNYFYGHGFIWCALHNFGGTLGLFGQTTNLNKGISEARASTKQGANLVGIGGTPEGINQNYILYDLLYSIAWSNNEQPIDLENWVRTYLAARYGFKNSNAEEAWILLLNSVYNYDGKERMRGKYTFNRRPSLRIRPWYWYNITDVHKAWNCMLNGSEALELSNLFKHDLIDITRQALQQIADQLYIKALLAYRNNDANELIETKHKFLSLLENIDEILGCDQHFMLSQWLEQAKSSATNDKERIQFEYNARNQITLWGPNGEIVDYANKQWSGVVVDYFKPRWEIFFDELLTAVNNNVTLDENAVQKRIFKEAEEPFTFSRKIYPKHSKGNAIDVSKRIFNIWNELINSLPQIIISNQKPPKQY